MIEKEVKSVHKEKDKVESQETVVDLGPYWTFTIFTSSKNLLLCSLYKPRFWNKLFFPENE